MAELQLGTIRDAPDGKRYVFLGGESKDRDRWAIVPSPEAPANASPDFGQAMQQELGSRNALEKYNAGWGMLPTKAYLGLKGMMNPLTAGEQQNYQGQKAIGGTLPGALGDISSNLATMGPVYGKLFGATAGMTPTLRNLANIVGSGTLGAATGALTSPGERGSSALKEGLGAATGTALGTLATGVYKPALGSEAALMQGRGVPITPGMAGGASGKSLEDARRAINPSVAARQNDAIEKWNERYLINDPLEAAGLSPVQGAGHGALQEAQGKFSGAYQAAGKQPIVSDNVFISDLRNVIQNIAPDMTATARKSFMGQLKALGSTLSGQTTTAAIRQAENDLNGLARQASDANQSKLAEGYRGVAKTLEDLRGRQGSTTPALDLSYAKFSRVKDAAAMKGPMDTGIVSPDQMKSAIRAASDRGERAFGEALMQQDMAKAGQVLGPTIPPMGPGTAEKVLRNVGMPGAGLGVLGYGMASGNWWPAGIASALYGANKLAYTRPGVRALTGGYPWQQILTPEVLGMLAAGGGSAAGKLKEKK